MVCLMAARRRPYLATGWLWFVISILPVSGIVQLGGQAIADRYTYVPLIGLFIAAVWLLYDLIRPIPAAQWFGGLTACFTVAGCAALTQRQISYWSDNESLFNHSLAINSQNWMAHISLGRSLASIGRLTEAKEHFKAALSNDPDSPDGHNNLANAMLQERDYDGAIEHYRSAISARPRFAIAHSNLGVALAAKGDLEGAIKEFQTAVGIDPSHEGARENLQNAIRLKNGSKP
jgi:tetratricopeptide (TPR) repeat protein